MLEGGLTPVLPPAELEAMGPAERIRYERRQAADANKEAMDEALRKFNGVAGDQDAADAKPSEEGIRNPAKWDKAGE